ncbi:GatB/YqeY domain-containing protein [Patescibacteria group bacterium]|nr:GatB/YqeY domain-containing protein [Patescibacteria group bacterium]
MTLQQNIKDQVKEAMKAKDAVRLGVVRGLVSSFTNELLNLKRTPQDELSDEEVLNVIRRAVKQRKDSIDQFTKGGREDLAAPEKEELALLEAYLPASMPREEVMTIAKAKMTEMGVIDKSKMGMFMGALMKDLKGKADGDTVKSVVEELLA